MTTLYLVTAQRGCYSDAQSWNVRAFPAREIAEAWRDRCAARVAEIEALTYEDRDLFMYPRTGYLTEEQAAYLGEFDQCLVYRPDRPEAEGRAVVGIWGGGEAPEYAVEEIPFGLP